MHFLYVWFSIVLFLKMFKVSHSFYFPPLFFKHKWLKKKLLAVLLQSSRLSLSFSLSFGSVTLGWVLMCRLWLHPAVLDFAEAARTAGTASSSRVSPSTSRVQPGTSSGFPNHGAPKLLTSSSRSPGKLLSDGSPVMNGSLLLSQIWAVQLSKSMWICWESILSRLNPSNTSRIILFFLKSSGKKEKSDRSFWIWVLCRLTNSFRGLLRGWMHKTNPKLWGTFEFCLDSPGRESHDQTSTASATSCRTLTLPSANEHKKKKIIWPVSSLFC